MSDDKIECWRCGCEYDEDDIFCPECDADIEPDNTVSDTNSTQIKSNTSSSQPYLAIICSQCGGGIILSNNKMTGSCSHCGTAFIANPKVVKPEVHFDTQAQKSKSFTSQITNRWRIKIFG